MAAHILVNHLFAGGLIHRQRRGRFQVANEQRGASSLVEQFHELAVQDIDSIAQFFQRHSILVLRGRTCGTPQVSMRRNKS
jgi:hypothetical protein